MKRKVYADGNGSAAVLIDGLGHYIPVNQAVALEKEIDQLKAQVEQLREFAELIVEWKEYGFEKAKTLLDSTPA